MVFFHKEITASAEIKQNSDWLKPCCPNGHTHFSAFKRGCSGLWASGQFGFSWILSVSDPALFCWQIKFYCTQPWRLLVTFWSLKFFGPAKKREVVYTTLVKHLNKELHLWLLSWWLYFFCCIRTLLSVDITQNIFYISLCFREQQRASSLSEVRTKIYS